LQAKADADVREIYWVRR